MLDIALSLTYRKFGEDTERSFFRRARYPTNTLQLVLHQLKEKQGKFKKPEGL
jgi:hypothetical protein